jgi:hypothetical protein
MAMAGKLRTPGSYRLRRGDLRTSQSGGATSKFGGDEAGRLSYRLKEGREIRKLMVSIVVLVFFLGLPGGCADSSRHKQGNEKPIGIRKQHDTRVFILCKDSQGEYYEKSLHKSAQVICGGKTFKLKDYTSICKTDCYIAFPGQEKELEKYLKKLKNRKD